jgi:preprotein translocase SecE subunit
VARDRKRARQRRRPVREPAPTPSQSRPADRRSAGPEISDPPAPLEHVGDVDEFDAALVRGAEGGRAGPLREEQSGNGSDGATASMDAPERRRGARGTGPAELEQAFGEGVAAEEAPVTRPSQPLYQRAIAFLRASWAELQRVQWPDRRHVTQATTVVLGFLVVAGVYLGLADWVAQKIVNFIL